MDRPSESDEARRLHVDPCEVVGGSAVVRLRGEADVQTAPTLRDVIDEAVETGARSIVVDLTGVIFVDSMMLSVLLAATRRSRPRGIEWRIVADDPHVRRIFELMLLDRVLPLYTSLQSALADGEP